MSAYASLYQVGQVVGLGCPTKSGHRTIPPGQPVTVMSVIESHLELRRRPQGWTRFSYVVRWVRGRYDVTVTLPEWALTPAPGMRLIF